MQKQKFTLDELSLLMTALPAEKSQQVKGGSDGPSYDSGSWGGGGGAYVGPTVTIYPDATSPLSPTIGGPLSGGSGNPFWGDHSVSHSTGYEGWGGGGSEPAYDLVESVAWHSPNSFSEWIPDRIQTLDYKNVTLGNSKNSVNLEADLKVDLVWEVDKDNQNVPIAWTISATSINVGNSIIDLDKVRINDAVFAETKMDAWTYRFEFRAVGEVLWGADKDYYAVTVLMAIDPATGNLKPESGITVQEL